MSGVATAVEGRVAGRPLDREITRTILAAADRQLRERGYAHVSMESVAIEAGVSRATVYRRFRDKGDLVTAAIAADGGGEFPAWPPADPRQELVRFMTEFDERFAEHCLEVIGGLVGAREDPEVLVLHRRRVVMPRHGYARSLLEEAQRRGELRADADLDLALEMVGGSVFYRRVAGLPGADGWAERAVGAIWAAMGTAPA